MLCFLAPLSTCIANTYRAVKDRTTAAANCCLFIIVLSLFGGSVSSSTAFSSEFNITVSIGSLVALIVMSRPDIWVTRGLAVSEAALGISRGMIYGVLILTQFLANEKFQPYRAWVTAVSAWIVANGTRWSQDRKEPTGVLHESTVGPIVLCFCASITMMIFLDDHQAYTALQFIPMTMIVVPIARRVEAKAPLKDVCLDFAVGSLFCFVLCLPYVIRMAQSPDILSLDVYVHAGFIDVTLVVGAGLMYRSFQLNKIAPVADEASQRSVSKKDSGP